MKRLSFFSVAIAVVLMSASGAHAQWATLKGQFLFGKEGTKVPNAAKLKADKDVQVCGKMPLYDESLVVNGENRGLAHVVLWADKIKKVHPDYEANAKANVKIDNLLCRFEPHAVAVRTSQTLVVGNSDPIGHNSLMNFLKNPPVNPIIPAKGEVKFTFSKPEIIPTKVSCSIHPWMQGIVLVQDHPYMAITDADGKFEMKNLPAGKVTIKIWHEKIGYVKTATIDNKATKFSRGRYSVTLKKDTEQSFVLDPKMFAGK